MRVLQIGQLPKEVGGNYTTGAANVVYELSKKKVKGLSLFTFATNTPDNKAKENSKYNNQYIGYRFIVLSSLFSILLHPLKTAHQLRHFAKVDHNSSLRFMFYKCNIERAIRLIQPDLIHVHSINNLSSTYYARGEKRIPILLTCHGIFYRGEPSDFTGRDIFLGNIGFADAYSGLTKESLTEYEKYLGISANKVSIIPNGVDCSKFYYDASKRAEIRGKMGVSPNTKVFITVASVQERKGQLSFIKIIKGLSLDYQYWIIGGGPDVPLVQKYIDENELNNKIRLLGYHKADELYGYYSAADIYAHVSTMEGQALCEIEASATGLRTIVDERIVGTVPDINSGDYYILNQNNFNVHQLEDWIMKDTIGRQSCNNLDWLKIAERYADLYNDVLKKYNS